MIYDWKKVKEDKEEENKYSYEGYCFLFTAVLCVPGK
jgi:hypothetical protein